MEASRVLRNEAEGRQLLDRYATAAQAISEAAGRVRTLGAGEPVISEVWNDAYLNEMERLEAEEDEARRKWHEWLLGE